jgi:thymidine kinase
LIITGEIFMAKMFPADNETFLNEGEKVFYRFIETAARPDSKYMCWYIPDIKGEEPDFIIYCEDVGLVIIEVKQWVKNQILMLNPIEARIDGMKQVQKNPLKQARDYSLTLREKLLKDGRLVSRDPRYQGKLKIPVSYGVAFPNIPKKDYENSDLSKVILPSAVFLWDDLHPDSDMARDPTGRKLLDQLKSRFPPLFGFTLSSDELKSLRELLFPEMKIELPARVPGKMFYEEHRHMRMLDENQEDIARKIDSGHRIIYGPSGSGKTLVLIHRAVNLLKYNPDVKKALFVCYNITLVNYIRRLLSGRKVPIGPSGIDVMHFYELCSKITGKKIEYEKESLDYYNLVVETALDKAKDCGLKYDLILIDEGQDFSNDMLKVVTALLNRKTNHLMIAVDDNQDIYRPQRTWKDAGIDAQGRIQRLTAVYRNTKQISRFAGSFAGLTLSKNPKDPNQERIFDDTFTLEGPEPEIIKYEDYPRMAEEIATQIFSLSTGKGIPLPEIAVLYTVKNVPDKEDLIIPELIKSALDRKGIISNWISEDYRAKKSYDISTDSVAISTIHSMKGMDFHCVFLIGLDLLEPSERWSAEQLKNLAYVGMTRARYQLIIPYVRENEMIRKLIMKG